MTDWEIDVVENGYITRQTKAWGMVHIHKTKEELIRFLSERITERPPKK